MEVITFEEFLQAGRALYGEDPRDWVFECSKCKTHQQFNDFVDYGISPVNVPMVLGRECIGRFDKTKGCDRVLGDVFTFHTLEVVRDSGKHEPIFKLVGMD